MFNEQLIIDYLAAETGYTVSYLADTKPTLADISSPKIYVGTVGIKHLDSVGTGRTDSDSIIYAEDMWQIVEIQFVCAVSALSSVWAELAGLLAGWHPTATENIFTGLSYIEGGRLGIENGRLWWADRWKIEFPIDLI